MPASKLSRLAHTTKRAIAQGEKMEDQCCSSDPIGDRMYRANYMVMPVCAMKAMPSEWQKRMIALMDQFSEAFPVPAESRYAVDLCAENGDLIDDIYYGCRHQTPGKKIN